VRSRAAPPPRQEQWDIRVFWGNRPESADICAAKMLAFLACLERCHSAFRRWRSLLGSAIVTPQTDPSIMRAIMLNGRNYTDFGHEVIEELGFSSILWTAGTQRAGESVVVSFALGSYGADEDVPDLSNNCFIDLPKNERAAARFLKPALLRALLACAVQVWAPLWGVVQSNLYLYRISPRPAATPEVGWMTYLRVAPEAVPPLPPPARVELFGPDASLIVLTDERFSARNPDHVALADRVRETLDRAGLLKPVRYW
jgi:hypothetical protein